MPRWTQEDDDAAFGVGIPLQFGPGRETIMPPAALVEYERGWSDRYAQLGRARDYESWIEAQNAERIAHHVARCALSYPDHGYSHLEYQHDQFMRLAAALRPYMRRGRDDYAHSRPQSGHDRELTRVMGQSVGSLSAYGVVFDGDLEVLGTTTLTPIAPAAPAAPPQFAQGMARPHGWQPVGPWPGYAPR